MLIRSNESNTVFLKGLSMSRLLIACLGLGVALMPGVLRAQEAPPTRIAVLNQSVVYSKYQRAIDTKKEMEATVQPYKILMEKMRSEATKLQQEATDQKADNETKNAAQQKLLGLRRKQEDLEAEARITLGRKSDQYLIDIHTDIQAAAQRLAEARNFDLVLVYGEPLNKEDVLKVANITRKMQAADQGAVVPIYIRPRIDITEAMLESLNEAYGRSKKD